MSLYNPEVHLWTITSWSAQDRARGYGFTLWVSPRFLAAAQEDHPSYDNLQQPARELVRNAGFRISDDDNPFSFVGLGLDAIVLPGEDCCLTRTPVSGGGAMFSSHNIDTPEQQVVLMALWLLWAQFVERDLWTRIGGNPIASAMQR